MEKQSLNVIKKIWKFSEDTGLKDQGYDDVRESAYPIEEALEGFDIDRYMAIHKSSPKEFSREIMACVGEFEGTDVDRLDKHLDGIVYNFNSIAKLGLTPQQAIKALGIVMDKNMEKIHAGQDDQGKQLKPEGFVGPEAQLQKILNERT